MQYAIGSASDAKSLLLTDWKTSSIVLICRIRLAMIILARQWIDFFKN